MFIFFVPFYIDLFILDVIVKFSYFCEPNYYLLWQIASCDKKNQLLAYKSNPIYLI